MLSSLAAPFRALALLLVAAGSLPVSGQYSGPAEAPAPAPGVERGNPATDTTILSRDEMSPFGRLYQQQATDIDATFPAAQSTNSASQSAHADQTISVAQLKHPLSRKARSMLSKAQTELFAGKTTEGFNDLEKALQDKSAVPYASSARGIAYLTAGKIPEAISELNRAVQEMPLSANFSNLAYAYLLHGDADQGEKNLQRALQLNPSSAPTHYLMGLVLLDSNPRNREACDNLRQAERGVPKAHIALAVCYIRGGNRDAAEQQVYEFAGTADASKVSFWKQWVALIAAEPHPSLAFGLRQTTVGRR